MTMQLYPAIDILGGNAVRLVQGDFDAKRVYDEDPLSAAEAWLEDGARALHVVDLDGAKTGQPINVEHLRKIAAAADAAGVRVQFGGGLRSLDAISEAIDAGAARVILGTVAFNDPELLRKALVEHGPDKVMVSVDVREGQVVVNGWTKPAADVEVSQVFAELFSQGVRNLAYTNVDRDGMLVGIEDLTWVAKAAAPAQLIYSGGIGRIDDLEHLAKRRAEAHLDNLAGVIVGKALYERRFTIAQAHEALACTPSTDA